MSGLDIKDALLDTEVDEPGVVLSNSGTTGSQIPGVAKVPISRLCQCPSKCACAVLIFMPEKDV